MTKCLVTIVLILVLRRSDVNKVEHKEEHKVENKVENKVEKKEKQRAFDKEIFEEDRSLWQNFEKCLPSLREKYSDSDVQECISDERGRIKKKIDSKISSFNAE